MIRIGYEYIECPSCHAKDFVEVGEYCQDDERGLMIPSFKWSGVILRHADDGGGFGGCWSCGKHFKMKPRELHEITQEEHDGLLNEQESL